MIILLSCLSRSSFKLAVHGGDVGESRERPPKGGQERLIPDSDVQKCVK